MAYPPIPDFETLSKQIAQYAQLKHDYGAVGIPPILAKA